MKEGWQIKRLGEVCDVINGGTPKTGIPDYWGGEYRWITPAEMGKRLNPYVNDSERRITEAGLRNSSAQMLPPYSVILSSRAPIGHLVINTEPMATNQGCKGLIPKNELLQHKFLYYYLTSVVELLNNLGTGATFKELSGGKLKDVTISIPLFPEQQRIVSILDEAFEWIATAKANAEKNLKNARAVFESELNAIFTKKWEGWEEKRLEQVVDKSCTLSYGIVQPGNECINGLPVVRPTDLTKKLVTISGLKRIDQKLATSYGRTTLRGGELLLCVRGSTGVVSVASAELFGANVTRGIVPISLDTRILTQDFGYYLMISEGFQNQIREKTYGAALMQINIRDLRKVTLSFPSLTEQADITAKLDALESETQRLESIYKRKLTEIDALKKSLLNHAFTGQL